MPEMGRRPDLPPSCLRVDDRECVVQPVSDDPQAGSSATAAASVICSAVLATMTSKTRTFLSDGDMGNKTGDEAMQTFTYAAEFEPGEKRGVVVVSFPDVPEAITQGDSPVDARAQAEEALGLALLTYPERGLPLPKPRAKGKKGTMVAVAPDVAAKLAVIADEKTKRDGRR